MNMKITSSAVTMASSREYSLYQEKESAELITTADKAATLTFSDESKSLLEQLQENKIKLEKNQDKLNSRNMLKSLETSSNPSNVLDLDADNNIKLQILRQMLDALNGNRHKKYSNSLVQAFAKQLNSTFMSNSKSLSIANYSGENGFASEGGQSTNVANNNWQRISVTSSFVMEQENTAYQTTGMAKTEDGRTLSFNVSIEMSRAFQSSYENMISESYVCKDPLVINLDSSVTSVSDQKFLFDIDSDGTEDSISFAGEGSGFLALDQNDDGVINDGSELFGTTSGDGFKDLANYDEDGNGWIDENDSVYEKLKVWTKDSEGNDRLLNLKAADVGAIYLDRASTEFSLKQEDTNRTNGIIRNTGIYLKESGGVGTVQHVDLAV